jgi:hypothetical protein
VINPGSYPGAGTDSRNSKLQNISISETRISTCILVWTNSQLITVPLIDVLRTYIRNTQISLLDSRTAQKQSRDCSNNQQTNQTAIYAHFKRSQRVTAPSIGPCKGCRERYRISKRQRANCVERVSRHDGRNIVSKQGRFIASQHVCVSKRQRNKFKVVL